MIITPPPADANFGFFDSYIKTVTKTDLIQALKDSLAESKDLFGSLSEEQLLSHYEPGKWNIKEIVNHLADAERNFCYRAMRFSRGEEANIPPFDIYQYTVNSHATERSINSLLDELQAFRVATIALYEHMPVQLLDKSGQARDTMISVRALGYAIVGHAMHHMKIVKEKYLSI